MNTKTGSKKVATIGPVNAYSAHFSATVSSTYTAFDEIRFRDESFSLLHRQG